MTIKQRELLTDFFETILSCGEEGDFTMAYNFGISLIYDLDKTDSDVKGIDHYYVWQQVGHLGDDYSGYMLYPLKNGKYFKVSYSC